MIRVLGGALAAAFLCFAGAPAEAQTTLRVANWLPPSHPLIAKIIRPWTEEVTKATQGRVKMQVLDSPLGPPPAHFDFAVNRIADVTYGVHNYTPGRFVVTELPELPFLANKSEHLSVAYWRVHEKFLAKANEHAGTKVLSVFTHGPGHLWTRKIDLKSVDNIKGAKIRIGGGVAQDVASALGMVPVQVPVTQAYEILSQGVADGIQFPAESVPFFNIHKVVDSGLVVDGGLYNVSFYVVMNQAAWDGLSKQDQEAILSVSGEKLALNAGKEWDAADAAAYKVMEEAKITIVRPDEKNMALLREKLKPVAETTLKQIADKGVDAKAAHAALLEELKKVSGK
jgi:TRAP-type C4-dicarboxylate transport system substrate-binding protein